MPAGPKVLRVFVSSTAMDLTVCREKVRDVILQLEQLPIGMETFTALPTMPAADCRKKAAESDVIVVMVAHRYGYVPSVELGGDGVRSITWLEVLAAKQAGKPVFAFLIDPKARWEQSKETDQLADAPDEKYAAIEAAVKGLRDFKAYLQANCTFDTFVNEDDLARKVATTLAMHVAKIDPDRVREGRVWRPCAYYPLQPAPHFQGRRQLLERLAAWAAAPVSPERVVSLVAVGGTGKTALAERVLAGLGERRTAGVFVWSFYEDPRTDAFLREACNYFTGQTPPSMRGLLERLLTALTGDDPHLFVLDGLERVQSEGRRGRPLGEVEDVEVRRFLRWLAAGAGTRARALVTSRFPLVDLDNWKDGGHREWRLEDLEPEAARSVLREWGVKGDDATLDGLARPLNNHALSVAVLGSYLGNLWEGDPTKAPTFDREEEAALDPKAARLQRLLASYASMLSSVERALLARLFVFSQGTTVGRLRTLVDAGGRIAGALLGLDEALLRRSLTRLCSLGLVFRYDQPQGQGTAFTAHPFLRDYFGNLLDGARPQDLHEAVRARLALSLESRPRYKPRSAEDLTRFEELIEHTRLAGKTADALHLFWFSMCEDDHLEALGEHARGLRIATSFASGGEVERLAPDVPLRDRAFLAIRWGRHATSLGELRSARAAYRSAQAAYEEIRDAGSRAMTLMNLANLSLLAGRLPEAEEAADSALPGTDYFDYGSEMSADDYFVMEMNREDNSWRALPYAYLGAARGWQGATQQGLYDFTTPDRMLVPTQDEFFYGDLGIWEVEFRLACGQTDRAMRQARANVERFSTEHQIVALYEAVMGRMLVGRDARAAQTSLDAARQFAQSAGDVPVRLRCYRLASELARSLGDCQTEAAEALEGVLLADGCGFGLFSIDLRLTLARAHLDAGALTPALQRAREALDRSTHPECQYAWGEADALHLCGVAHVRLGEHDLARQRLTAALARREALTHPGTDDTRAELARLGG